VGGPAGGGVPPTEGGPIGPGGVIPGPSGVTMGVIGCWGVTVVGTVPPLGFATGFVVVVGGCVGVAFGFVGVTVSMAIGRGGPAGPFHSDATVAVRNTTAAARITPATFTRRSPSGR
jgi:hypothetical protein